MTRARRTHAGAYVLVAGPDGSGKSTLVQRLSELGRREFQTVRTMHWRPGILPQLGRLAGLGAPDSARPHSRPPYGLPVSLIRLVYYWVDQVIGYWLLVGPLTRQGGLVIMERGYWDLLVDPRRYRIGCPPWIVRLLGVFVPRPRLTVVLGGDPAIIAARKDELPTEEVARQLDCWRRLAPRCSLLIYDDPAEHEIFDLVVRQLRILTRSVEGADV